MRNWLFILLLLCGLWVRGFAHAQPIPPPPPGMADDLEEDEEEEDEEEDMEDAPMMRPPPMPNPMNSANPNYGGGGGPIPVPGNNGRSDLGFNRASNSPALGTTGIRSGPAKFKFQVLDGEFWERGKKRGRSSRGTPAYSGSGSASSPNEE